MSPDRVYLLFFSIMALVLVVALRFALRHKSGEKGAVWAVRFLCLWFILLTLGFLTVSHYSSLVPSQSVVVDRFGKERARFQKAKRLWTSDPTLRDSAIFSYAPRQLAIVMTVSPITENPKVRQLKYRLEFRVGGAPENAIRFREEAKKYAQETDWLKSRMFEFNEQKSCELAKFYNPLEEQQQREFFWMVHEWLNDDLQRAGITLVEAGFSLP